MNIKAASTSTSLSSARRSPITAENGGRRFDTVYPMSHRLESIGEQFALEEPGKFYFFTKRALDVVCALIGLFVLALLIPIVGLFILIEDGWPLFYTVNAVGFLGKPFRVLKFRSMHIDAETYFEHHPDHWAEYQQNLKLKNDPRVLRVGKWLRKTSIDELPQMLNILRGEMTLVGPRYVRPDELSRYGRFAEVRVQMIPGLTGLWQVSGRSEIPYDLRVVYDRTYYYTRSLGTDVKILLATLPVVLFSKGAY